MSFMEVYCIWIQALVFLPTLAHREEQVTMVKALNPHVPVKLLYGENRPAFTKPLGNYTFTVGREAVIPCFINYLGNHTVGWLRHADYAVLTMHERTILSPRFTCYKQDEETWLLKIRHLRADDAGCYMCQINTQPTMIYQLACIDVHVPPDIISENQMADVSAVENENASMTCNATGHPKPKITWRREDHAPLLMKKPGTKEFYKLDFYKGETLFLYKVDRRQMGTFLCIARNTVPPAVSRRITLLINFPPSVYVPNQLLGSPLGSDVKFQCNVEAYPNTINYWVKNHSEMLLDGPKYKITQEKKSYKVTMWLIVLKIEITDIGTYNCVSTNSLGKSEGTLRLYQIDIGNFKSNNRISVSGLTKSTEQNDMNAIKATRTIVFIELLCYIFFNYVFN